jgi:hypothetical protein
MLLQKNVRQNPRGTKTAIWIKTWRCRISAADPKRINSSYSLIIWLWINSKAWGDTPTSPR